MRLSHATDRTRGPPRLSSRSPLPHGPAVSRLRFSFSSLADGGPQLRTIRALARSRREMLASRVSSVRYRRVLGTPDSPRALWFPS